MGLGIGLGLGWGWGYRVRGFGLGLGLGQGQVRGSGLLAHGQVDAAILLRRPRAPPAAGRPGLVRACAAG